MASRDLINRIQEAFKEPDKVNAEEYQKIVETLSGKVTDNVERMLLFQVGLIAIFVLIAENQIGILKIENFELKEFSVIAILIPLLFSYIHFNLVTSLAKFEQLSVLYKTIIRIRHEPIYKQRLTEFFLSTPNLYDYKHFARNGIVQGAQFILWAIEFFTVTLLIPFAFQGYAFFKLFSLYGSNYPLLIGVSLAIAIIFGLQSFFCVITLVQETAPK